MTELSDVRDRLLAERLRGRARASGVAKTAITATTSPTPVRSADRPMSFGQQRLYFLDRLSHDSPEYALAAAWRVTGDVDQARLAEAVGRLVGRHEVLRSTFLEVDGVPVQRTGPAEDIAVEWRHAESLAAATQQARAVIHEPFDLGAAPVFRVLVWTVSAHEHVLLTVMHHIVSDGWSMDVLIRELSALYAGETLPALPLQFADLAEIERAESAASGFAGKTRFWRDALAGMADLDLPTDRPRRGVVSGQGGACEFVLDPALVGKLRELSRQRGATMYMVLLAAFEALIGRWSEQADFGVGTPVAGRSRPEADGLIGFFANTVVMRARLAGDPSFAQLVDRVRDTALEALEHQDVPFEKVVEALNPHRALHQSALFQVMFNLVHPKREEFSLGTAVAEPVALPLETVKFDVQLEMEQVGDRVSGAFCYRGDLWEQQSMRRLTRQYQALLEAVAGDPDIPLSRIDLVDPAERRQVLAAGQASARYDSSPTLHELFERNAAAQPGEIAVVSGGREITYGELNRQANRLARRLRAAGVGAESLVGVYTGRRLELVVAILAVLKAGAAYVPLDPDHPRERLEFTVADAGLGVVATAGQPDAASLGNVRIVNVGDEDDDASNETSNETSTGNLDLKYDPGNLAYVIYTSGSTGRPKGVAIEHRQVVRLIRAVERELSLPPRGVWPLFHAYAFDVSVFEMWSALARGGRLLVVPREDTRDPFRYLDFLEAHGGATIANLTPGAFRGVRTALAERGRSLASYGVRHVILAGEKVEPGELADWFERTGTGVELVNMYGITETTVHSTHRILDKEDIAGPARSPVGGKLGDLRAYVLDRRLCPVPVGVAGELFIGGAGLARGYHGRPDLTAERFLPDPFAGEPGARMYKSGDRVRWLSAGELDYLGRYDDQVQVRGHRVEPGEVEAVLLRHPKVRQAAVVPHDDQGTVRLVAYIVSDGEPPAHQDLREWMLENLPEPMVPATFLALPALPLTANGKLDRRALPAPDGHRPDVGVAYVEPASPAERALAEVWRETLGLAQVGLMDRFFDLGGDSILALRVVGRARARGWRIEVADIFRFQSLRELALAARRDDVTESDLPAYALLADEDRAKLPPAVVDAYPWTRMQQGMLYEMLTTPERGVYHNVTSFRIRESAGFSLDGLRAAAADMVRRHEILRTSFDWQTYSQGLQLVHAGADLPVGFADLRGAAPAEQEATVRAYMQDESTRLFDLSRPPLIRLFAHRMTDDEYRLTLTDCHAVLDGWSLTSLIEDLAARHRRHLLGDEQASSEQARAGQAPSEQAPPRFATYVALEQETLADERARSFFADMVAARPQVRLPGDAGIDAPEANTGAPGTHEVLRRFGGLAPAIKDLARRAEVPTKSVLLAAYFRLMGTFAGAEGDGYSTGLVTNGRPETDGADRMRGLFLNVVPFGLEVTGRTWLELLRATFTMERDIMPFRRYPASELQRGHPERRIDTAFNYVHFHGLSADHKQDIYEIARTDLALMVTVGPADLSFEVDASRISAVACEQLVNQYLAIIVEMLSDPEARLPAIVPVTSTDDTTVVRNRAASPAPQRAAQPPARTDLSRAEVESKLAEIWADALDVDAVGRQDDFFDLGGTSLTVMRIAARAQELGWPLEVGDVLEQPTVAQLAELLTGEDNGRDHGQGKGEVRVTLGKGASRPLFCVHPSGGSVAWYQALARALGDDRRVIGLQARGLAGGRDADTVDELAADYIGEMRAEQPAGPYAMLGWSLGANIAQEMARQLTDAGEQVAQLLLLDPMAPESATGAAGTAIENIHQALDLHNVLRQLPAGSTERPVLEQRLRDALRAAGANETEVSLGPDSHAGMWLALLRAQVSHQPRPYAGRVELITCGETRESSAATPTVIAGDSYAEYEAFWRELLPAVRQHDFPGTHRSMMSEPVVGSVAAMIGELLDGSIR